MTPFGSVSLLVSGPMMVVTRQGPTVTTIMLVVAIILSVPRNGCMLSLVAAPLSPLQRVV